MHFRVDNNKIRFCRLTRLPITSKFLGKNKSIFGSFVRNLSIITRTYSGARNRVRVALPANVVFSREFSRNHCPNTIKRLRAHRFCVGLTGSKDVFLKVFYHLSKNASAGGSSGH